MTGPIFDAHFHVVDPRLPAMAMEKFAEANPDALMFGTDLPSTRARRPFEPADIELVERTLGPALARKALHDTAPAPTRAVCRARSTRGRAR
jgi:predicted TIM-barrel fold metal-dependent hydrolase